MIKKFLSKYILEVIPSIFATVVGAYIVTHYINAKPDADKPQTAITAPADTSKAGQETPKAEAARLKAEKQAAEKAAAERAAADRAENAKKAAEKLAAEKAVASEKAVSEKAATEKIASEKAAADKRERDRAVAKTAPVAPPSSEANAASDDKRDANDLARAAIERLRKTTPPSSESRTPETARVEEPKREPERAKVNSVVYAPAATPQTSIQPLPPAVTVAPAPSEAAIMAPPAPFPTPVDSAEARASDSSRPMPPGEIPPRDIRNHERERSVAEGVVSAARSVFQAVMPERN